jgi:hypothetical protein
MKEEFVTYEVALKLKEKGFREKCVAHYFNDEFVLNNYTNFRGVCVEELMMSFNALCDTKDLYPNFYKCADAPTISQVFKWLREVKRIDAGVVWDNRDGKWIGYINEMDMPDLVGEYVLPNTYDAYEQAALAGIEYVLCNLI